MKIVRAFVLVVVVSSSFVVMAATEALACSCVAPRPDSEAAMDAAAVFTGTVIDSEVRNPGGRGEWTFAVDTIYTGDVSRRQLVHSHTSGAACGFLFEEGKRYAVFAFEGDKSMAADAEFSTNSCMNTRALRDGKELKLEPIRDFAGDVELMPVEDGDVEVPSWLVKTAVVGLAVVVGVVVYFAVRRRRARPPGGPGTPTDPPG